MVVASDKPDWLDQLKNQGYCVVPNCVPKEHCEEFAESAWEWLESFPYGFKRDDRSTWKTEHMPYGFTGGLYNRYAVNHEDFVWKIRLEPKIKDAFAKIWGTDDLVVSFDGMNTTLPINQEHGRTDLKPTEAWPHMDQSPQATDSMLLIQGIANLAPNGPDDGGLVVLAGSNRLHDAFFESQGGRQNCLKNARESGYSYTPDDIKWYKKHGAEEVKICAGPGDLLLWDSRTIHWNASPIGTQTRFATYVAWTPRALMSEEDLARKLHLLKNRRGTTGWPHKNVVPEDRNDHMAQPRRPDGTVDPANRSKPRKDPGESQAMLYSAGVRN